MGKTYEETRGSVFLCFKGCDEMDVGYKHVCFVAGVEAKNAPRAWDLVILVS